MRRRRDVTLARALWGVALLAVAAAAFAAGPVADRGDTDARLTATAADGSFTHSNSRDGLPLFTAAGIAPGDSASGTVTLTNTGTLAGRFALSAADVADVVGPGGGVLSDRLQLTVRDVTAPASPLVVYAGALGAMGLRDLGTFTAGETRTYEFVATLPDGGTAGGDNAFQQAQTSVRYVWTATSEETSTPPPDSAPPSSTLPPTGTPVDRRPPRLRVRIPRVQRVFGTRRLALRLRCGEPCLIRARGWIRAGGGQRLRLPPRRARARASDARLVRIRVPRPHRRLLRRALVQGRTVRIRLVVAVADRAGNRTVARRTLRVRGR